ncbi:IS3 family transposase, partial [Gordonia sp. 4N]
MEFVAAHRDEHGVDPICAALRDTSAQIAPSTVRAHLSPQKTEAPRVVRDRELLTQVRAVHADNLGVYGARKVHAQLRRQGHSVARCTVERLMKADGLQGIARLKTRKTTRSEGAETPRPADRVNRQFTAAAP